jgi:uncharacterized protein YodC (DUF2158 family)
MKISDEVKLVDGGNVYVVIEDVDRHVLLKCVWFSQIEDLGDRIFCTRESQEIWIAKYFVPNFEIIEKETS